MPMALSEAGRKALTRLEGCRLLAYRDVGGVLTIGVGHTGPDVYAGKRITLEEAEVLLAQDVEIFERAVNANVTVPLTQQQFDALVIFVFNVGIGAFSRSTLVRLLNAGDYDAVPAQLRRWNRVGGVVVQGLVHRREAEIKIWNGA